MKKNYYRGRKKVYALLAILLFAGCASKPSSKTRFFWPPLPDVPKIEYIASYQTTKDVAKEKKWDKLIASTFGEERKQMLIKPWGIASNGEGKVYITDFTQASVVIFDTLNGSVSGIGGIDSPRGITIDKKGRLFVTSRQYKSIMAYNTKGSPLYSFGSDVIESPSGIAVNNILELIYVVDSKAHDVKVFNLKGEFLFSIGKRGRGQGEFNFPSDVDLTSKGEVVVVDAMNARIQIFSSEGSFIRAFGRRGDRPGEFNIIKGVAIDSEDHIYVTDAMAGNFKIFSMEGELLLVVGATYPRPVPGGFNLPMDIDIDKNDRIYIVDQMNFAFQVYQFMNKDYLMKHPVSSDTRQ